MNLKQYQIETLRTFAFRKEALNTSTTDMLHCAIGVASEVGELIEAIEKKDIVNIGEEIADQMWYVSNLGNFIGLDMYSKFIFTKKPFYEERNFYVNRAVKLSSGLLDIFKKVVFYNKELDTTALAMMLFDIIQNLYDLCNVLQIDIEKLLDNNIGKLRKRFPEKFTEELAENRNLGEERKELEK